jgi:plasmid stabilization system protein ParE
MPQLKYSARASKDLIRLFNFLAETDERLAQRALLAIRDAFTPLMHMPKMGRPVAGGLREQIIAFGRSGYVALYDFDEVRDVVVVLAVRHQREVDYKS